MQLPAHVEPLVLERVEGVQEAHVQQTDGVAQAVDGQHQAGQHALHRKHRPRVHEQKVRKFRTNKFDTCM